MKVYKTPVKAYPFANQVKVSKTQEGSWLIVRGANWTELPACAFNNWDEALWTGISWANDEYLKEIEYAEAEAVWQLQHATH
jgi:hypothetical protein